jgi:hypothetical protein
MHGTQTRPAYMRRAARMCCAPRLAAPRRTPDNIHSVLNASHMSHGPAQHAGAHHLHMYRSVHAHRTQAHLHVHLCQERWSGVEFTCAPQCEVKWRAYTWRAYSEYAHTIATYMCAYSLCATRLHVGGAR